MSHPTQASARPSAVNRRTRNGSSRHANTAIGTSAITLSVTIQRSAGKIVNRKLIVSVSTIIRSTKFAVIISTWYLSCDKRTSTVIIVSDSVAANIGRRVKASQKKFNIPQASANAAMAVAVASVATMMTRAIRCGSRTSAGRTNP